MALVSVISIGIEDYTGGKKKRKTLPLYVLATMTLAQIQTLVNDFTAELDGAIDGKIVDAGVFIALSIPGTLKADPIVGNTVHEGAGLSFDAANTAYSYGVYIPSWKNAGFSGDQVDMQAPFSTAVNEFLAVSVTDEDGNDLVSYQGGERTFRK